MKFRTDFVTNSSSSSFMSVTFHFSDSYDEECVYSEEGEGWNNYFKKNEEGLFYKGYPIKTIEELFAILFFYAYSPWENKTVSSFVQVGTFLFLFITKNNIDFHTLTENIEAIQRENKGGLDWEEIDRINEIDSDDYDNEDELIDAVRELFDYANNDFQEELIDLYEKYRDLAEIESIDFYEDCREHGEFLNHFYDNLPGDYNFPQMSMNDPLFQKEVNKWTDLVLYNLSGFHEPEEYRKIQFGDDFDEEPLDMESAIESGNVEDCLQGIRHIHTYISRSFCLTEENNVSSKIDSDSNDDQTDAELSKINRRIQDCILQCDWVGKEVGPDYIVEKIKEIVDSTYFLQSLCKYPITDLVERAAILNSEKALDCLIQSKMKLDFFDVAHYIYNDTLGTLYPLFEKGLKIEESAYDGLIDYASEHGKPEYTAWLLEQKNKTSVN